MSKPIIRPYKSDDFKQVIPIMIEAFHSKFENIGALTQDEMAFMLETLRVIPQDESEGIFVAELDQKILGVMVLKWRGQKQHLIN